MQQLSMFEPLAGLLQGLDPTLGMAVGLVVTSLVALAGLSVIFSPRS